MYLFSIVQHSCNGFCKVLQVFLEVCNSMTNGIGRFYVCTLEEVKGGGGGDIYNFSWKINWSFLISRTINSAFHVLEEKINRQNHVSRGIER